MHGVPAVELILSRMPATLELALVALVIAVGAGVPLGLLAGLAPRSLFSRTVMVGSIFGFSLPNFWLGLMLILAFAVNLQVLPAGGRGETRELFGVAWSLGTLDGLRHLILPALTLAIYKGSLVVRLAYAGTREAMLQDFVRFARAKGLAPARIVGVHVLKTVLIPVVTVLGLELGSMIAFAVVTETVFAWPGMGKLLIESIYRLDRPVIVAYLMVVVVMFVLINLAVDLIYMALDPRVRLSERSACMTVSFESVPGRRAGPRLRRRPAVAGIRRKPRGARRARLRRRAVRAGARRAVDRAAEPLRPRAAVDPRQQSAARLAQRRRARLLARHRRPGPRPRLGDPLRPAAEPVRRRERDRASGSRSAPPPAPSRPISAASSTPRSCAWSTSSSRSRPS